MKVMIALVDTEVPHAYELEGTSDVRPQEREAVISFLRQHGHPNSLISTTVVDLQPVPTSRERAGVAEWQTQPS